MRSDTYSIRRAIFAVARAILVRRRTSSLTIALVLLSVSSCGFQKKTETPLPSESADTTANYGSPPVAITLNMHDLGTTADLRKLREKVREIMQSRAANGLFMVGSTEIENTVYIIADEHVSVGMLGDILAAVNENGGKAYLPLKTEGLERPDDLLRPNPTTLIVSAGDTKRVPWIFAFGGDKAGLYAVSPVVETLSDPKKVKAARAIGSSLEISANGEYFLNGPTVYLSTMDIDEVEIEQRRIGKSMLPTEFAALVPTAPSDPIRIVASEFAPAAPLFEIFRAIDATKYKWKIVVRRAKTKTN